MSKKPIFYKDSCDKKCPYLGQNEGCGCVPMYKCKKYNDWVTLNYFFHNLNRSFDCAHDHLSLKRKKQVDDMYYYYKGEQAIDLLQFWNYIRDLDDKN